MREFKPGERVIVTCHAAHTTFGGLLSESHEHAGLVSSVSIKGNVWVWLDDEAGPPKLCVPNSLNLETEET